MIKISNPNLDDLAEDYFYNFFVKKGFLKKLFIAYLSEKNEQRAFLRYILKRIREVITGRPDVLEHLLKNELERNFPQILSQIANTTVTQEARKKVNPLIKNYNKLENPSSEEIFSARLEYAFNYKKFSGVKDTNSWGAYYLVKKLQVNVCPYCNRIYTHTFRPKRSGKRNIPVEEAIKGATRPELDHFYNQARYPFFALSFFNLIPSCHVCNSNFKGSQPFDNHLNPYDRGFDDDVRFITKPLKRLDQKYIDNWYNNPDFFEIDFKPNPNANPAFIQKANNNITHFQLKELYQFHKDSALEVIIKEQMYNKAKIESLIADFPNLFPTKESVIRLITSNYPSINDLNKRPLSKLIRDICHEYGIN